MAAMSGVDDDLADLQPERANQRPVTGGGGRASRVSGRRSAVSEAAAAERDFFRRKEDDEDFDGNGKSDFASLVSSAPEASVASLGVASGRIFSCSSVATFVGALSSASTIVFGILRFEPLTATVVLMTPTPLAGFAESGGLESALAVFGRQVGFDRLRYCKTNHILIGWWLRLSAPWASRLRSRNLPARPNCRPIPRKLTWMYPELDELSHRSVRLGDQRRPLLLPVNIDDQPVGFGSRKAS